MHFARYGCVCIEVLSNGRRTPAVHLLELTVGLFAVYIVTIRRGNPTNVFRRELPTACEAFVALLSCLRAISFGVARTTDETFF